MVVLTEEFHGMSLKRKVADEPGLFNDSGSGAAAADDDRSSSGLFPLSCRATKMRRLTCRDGDDGDQAAAVDAAAVAATGPWREDDDDDVAMGDGDAVAATSASPGSVVGGGDGERAVVVVYGTGDGDGSDGGGGGGGRGIDGLRLRADWIRAMLREADSRTVRELLAGGAALERRFSESDDLAMAVVPWVAPTPTPAAATEEETAAAEDGAAAMDVEGDDEGQEGGRPWSWTGHGQAAAGGEELAYRWPQHCWAAAVAQASPPVMWSW